MAALNRPKTASYEVHESFNVDTTDNEDHTFCGIMFPIKAKELLPVEQLVINSVSIRGQLGPITVWVTNANVEPERIQREISSHGRSSGRGRPAPDATALQYNFRLDASHWTKIYEATHAPSQREYCKLDLAAKGNAIVLKPGQVRALYIHSTLDGDEAIVYDNSKYTSTSDAYERPAPRHEDAFLSIWTGKAHLCATAPFGQMPIWGWGNAWRDRREFVGQLDYGVVYKLWNPEIYKAFGNDYRNVIQTLLMCQRRNESPVSILPDECIYYILNMCRWDWFNDSTQGMKTRRRLLKRNQRQAKRKLQQGEEVDQKRQKVDDEEEEDRKMPAIVKHCPGDAAIAAGSCSAGPPPVGAATVTSDGGGMISDMEDYHSAREMLTDQDDDEESHMEEEDSDEEEEDEEEDQANYAAAAGGGNPVVIVAGNAPSAASTEETNDGDDEGEDGGDDNASEASDESAWERANGYRADSTMFSYQDFSSDDDDSDDDEGCGRGRRLSSIPEEEECAARTRSSSRSGDASRFTPAMAARNALARHQAAQLAALRARGEEPAEPDQQEAAAAAAAPFIAAAVAGAAAGNAIAAAAGGGGAAETANDDDDDRTASSSWIRRSLARLPVIRSLAAGGGGGARRGRGGGNA